MAKCTSPSFVAESPLRLVAGLGGATIRRALPLIGDFFCQIYVVQFTKISNTGHYEILFALYGHINKCRAIYSGHSLPARGPHRVPNPEAGKGDSVMKEERVTRW
jgi:hypothetical protein